MVLDPKVFRGTFPNKTLFMTLFEEYTKKFKPSKAIIGFAHALDEKPDVIGRLISGDTRAREKGYQLRPSVALAQKLEDLLGQPRGTFGGQDINEAFPPGGLADVNEEPNPDNNIHIVPGVMGEDLEESPRTQLTAGFYLVPLDKLGLWGGTLLEMLHPFLKAKAIANQIPILVEHTSDFDIMAVTAPLPFGDRQSTLLPAEWLLGPMKGCTRVSGQQALQIISEMYMAFVSTRMEEVKSKTLAKATLQDQLAGMRQHIGDLQATVNALVPMEGRLTDLLHDVSATLGATNPVTQDLQAFSDSFEAVRQLFRGVIKAIQAPTKG